MIQYLLSLMSWFETLDLKYIGWNIIGSTVSVLNITGDSLSSPESISNLTNFNIGVWVGISVIIMNLARAYKYYTHRKKNICKIDEESK